MVCCTLTGTEVYCSDLISCNKTILTMWHIWKNNQTWQASNRAFPLHLNVLQKAFKSAWWLKTALVVLRTTQQLNTQIHRWQKLKLQYHYFKPCQVIRVFHLWKLYSLFSSSDECNSVFILMWWSSCYHVKPEARERTNKWFSVTCGRSKTKGG